MTVVLWDVDGTLVKAGEAGRLAFADAVAAVFGVDVPPELLPRMAGKTDPQIALEVLGQLDVPAPDRHLEELQLALEAALTARVPQIRREGVVLPGVREALDGLAAAGAVQTLVTGNVTANARTKLAAVGLLDEEGQGPLRLDIGAYGSDDADRDNLVPIAMDRCRAAGFTVSREATWVVGDTPRDLACARAAGVRCLLVATGGYERDALEQAGADAVFGDLLDTSGVVRLLTG
jgi:phosphoglycolate phosphatase-like HAD superfamily hydrolase